ncbi:MAG: hypothetical protein ACPGJE_02565 [Wenzhouxiangellaceae bacterium]
MTGNHSNSDHDVQRPGLEQQYREQRGDGPPPELDRVVLARAHRALAHARGIDRGRLGRRASRGAWLTGVTTASVALLALAVVLQQAAPPTANPESEALFSPASPANEPDRQLRSDARDQAWSAAGNPTDASPSEREVLQPVRMEDRMRRTRPALESPPAGPAPAEAAAPPAEAAEAGSRLQAPEADFEALRASRSRPIAAESDEVYINAGDPTQTLKDARRALFVGVRDALARGDEDAARTAIERHRAIDPELRLPEELAGRLSIQPPPEPD